MVPKLNLVLMVVLTLAVIAGAGFLVLDTKTDARAEESARQTKLLRKLADNDPDLRRDAETELRRMGSGAAVLLREAAKSPDALLAGRAVALLDELHPPAPVAPKPAPAVAHDPFEFAIECPQGSLERGEPVRVRVRFTNHSPEPAVLFQGPGPGYAAFARFEVTDPAGRVHRIPPEASPSRGASPVSILPDRTLDLYAGIDLLIPAEQAGPYLVRFVWDAGEGSTYRKACDPFCGEQNPLPPMLLASNTLTLQLVD